MLRGVSGETISSTTPKTRAEFCDPDWFAGCGMLVTGGFCYRMLSDES
jgi:hypothetical protein